MARVTGFTAERMLEIENSTVVDGEVDAYHNLILKTRGGQNIDAGSLTTIPQVTVQDTDSVDLTIAGAGSLANPWKISAETKDQTIIAWLDPAFRFGSSSLVKMEGQSGLVGPFNWVCEYDRQGPRRVRMVRQGNTYVIAGQIPDKEYALTLGPNWYTYSRLSVDNTFADQIKAVQLKTGLVVLSGLIRLNASSAADGSLIAKLPPELAPDCSILLPVLMGDQAHNIRIWPNGDITAWGSYPGSTYLSFDGVCFYPKSANIPWALIGDAGSGFSSAAQAFDDVANWGSPKFYKDEYGFVWFQGLLRLKAAISADNTNLVSMPSSHRVSIEQHFRGAGHPGSWVGLGGQPTNGLNWKPNSVATSGSYMSITGVVFTTADAIANNPWSNLSFLANGWTFHSLTASVLRREDGLCMGRGLIVGGSLNLKAFRLEPDLWARRGKIILATISNNGNGRINVSSRDDIEIANQPGGVSLGLGSNWFSLDTMQWVR